MAVPWGAIIGAGASLLGGVLSDRGRDSANEINALVQREQNERNEALQREFFDKNVALQREFAQHGVRWRVEDAKAAGLHPLFALTGGGAAYSPTAVVGGSAPQYQYGESGLGRGLSQAGQSLARAVDAQATEEEREESALRRSLLRAQIDQMAASSQALRSQAARAGPAQAGISFAEPGSTVETFPYREVDLPEAVQLSPIDRYDAGYPGKYDVVKPKAVEIESVSQDAPWVMAGPTRAGFQRYRLTRNMELILPYNQEGWSEGLESVPTWMYPMVYQANKEYYGSEIWKVILQELGADNPFSKYVLQAERAPRYIKSPIVHGEGRAYENWRSQFKHRRF